MDIEIIKWITQNGPWAFAAATLIMTFVLASKDNKLSRYIAILVLIVGTIFTFVIRYDNVKKGQEIKKQENTIAEKASIIEKKDDVIAQKDTDLKTSLTTLNKLRSANINILNNYNNAIPSSARRELFNQLENANRISSTIQIDNKLELNE